MKEQVTKFNLQDAFKALDELDIPKVGGVRPNKDNKKELRESFKPLIATDCLIEDYYDVNNQEDLVAAQNDRKEEVAQAKLSKIQKIVDLDAETPEDVQPTYVGKTVVQCPQCMTVFYRNPEDLSVSEEDNTLVNVGEACPNCGHDGGYTVMGKIVEETPVDINNSTEEIPAENTAADINVEEPAPEEGTEEIPEASENEEVPTEGEEEVNLEPVEEPAPEENKEEEKPEEEEEKKEESFEAHSENILAEQVENALKEEIKEDEPKEEVCQDCGKNPCECKKEETITEAFSDKKLLIYTVYKNGKQETEEKSGLGIEALHKLCKDRFDSDENIDGVYVAEIKDGKEIPLDQFTECNIGIEESLNEDINSAELNKKLDEHNEYIKVLQDEIKSEENAIKNAKNDFIKKMHEKNLESLKAALDEAIPAEVKAETAVEELPTPEDAGKEMSKNEAVEEKKPEKPLKEADDAVAKEAPEEGDKVELKQRAVSEIHKGKEEHVPGAIVDQEINESLEESDNLKESSVEAELAAFMANLDEECKSCTEDIEEKPASTEIEEKPDSTEEVKASLDDFLKDLENDETPKNEFSNEALQEDGQACDVGLMKEINKDMSFKELINDPTFKKFDEDIDSENLKEELPADLMSMAKECEANIDKINAEDQAYIDKLETTQIEDADIEKPEVELEELNDSYINKTISNYLTEVYSNVDNFTATNCTMIDDKLIIEGQINFKSGKIRDTKFEFTEAAKNIYEGTNTDLATDGKFTLNCSREDGGKTLMAESLSYSYKINDNLVEGLTTKIVD